MYEEKYMLGRKALTAPWTTKQAYRVGPVYRKQAGDQIKKGEGD